LTLVGKSEPTATLDNNQQAVVRTTNRPKCGAITQCNLGDVRVCACMQEGAGDADRASFAFCAAVTGTEAADLHRVELSASCCRCGGSDA
jgi:hypothetical protein